MFNTPGFVGCRIVSDGCVGTIRFIGTLPNSEGVWYGVEWDDLERGKHDGTYNGVRYFFTSAPKSGSFIRLRKIDFGVSLWSAIETRYGEKLSDEVEASGVALRKMALKNGSTNENRAENLDRDVYIAANDKLNGTRKRVEVVGLGKLERQRTFQKLTQISLRGASVNLLPFATASEWGGDGNEKRGDSRIGANGVLSGGHVLAERDANRADRCENDIERFERFAALNLTNLRVLDLAANLFHSWAQIVRIAHAVPTLSELVLNENRLAFLRVTNAPPCLAALHESTSGLPSPTLQRSVNNRNDLVMRVFDEEHGTMSLDSVHTAFARVESVHLKATGARWRDVLRVASYFPNLRELHACANRICASDFKSEVEMDVETTGLISGPPSELGSTGGSESGFGSQYSVEFDTSLGTIDLNAVFGKLEFLCLEDNPITDSAVFDVLSTMQSLRTLVLRRAALGSLRLSPKSGSNQHYFPALAALNLVGNQLASWRDVDELNKLAVLRDLRISENPLLVPSNSTTASTTPLEHQFAVARLPNVARLNGIEIDKEERKAAERDYVRFYADDYVTAARQAAAADAFHVQHPRFATLLSAFPDLSDRCARAIAPPSASASTSANSSGSNSQLVSVTFRLDMPAPSGALGEVTRSVPRTMTIDKVKALAQRLLRLRVGSLRLSYAHAQASERVHLDNELRTLAYYDVTQNGTVIFVTF